MAVKTQTTTDATGQAISPLAIPTPTTGPQAKNGPVKVPQPLTLPDGGSVTRTTDNLWKVYGNVSEWIRFSDTKAGYILGADTVLVGAALSVFNGNSGFVLSHPLVLVMLSLALLAALVSIFYCLSCIRPNLGSGEATSLIFFHHIHQKHEKHEDYAQAMRQAHTDEEEFLDQLSQQIHANAKVATSKSQRIITAFNFSSFMLALLLASALTTTFYTARQRWQAAHPVPRPVAAPAAPVAHAVKPKKP